MKQEVLVLLSLIFKLAFVVFLLLVRLLFDTFLALTFLVADFLRIFLFFVAFFVDLFALFFRARPIVVAALFAAVFFAAFDRRDVLPCLALIGSCRQGQMTSFHLITILSSRIGNSRLARRPRKLRFSHSPSGCGLVQI